MSTVDYINRFVEYFTMLIDLLKGFVEGLFGKAPEAEDTAAEGE